MRSQYSNSSGQPTAPPILGFLKRNLPMVVFLVVAFVGMVAVYWFFSPDEAEIEAANVAAAITNEEGALTAPIHKSIPAKPVEQRLAQSPGPIRIGLISGHQGFDSGAVCPDGLTEAQVNAGIVDKVIANLQALGIRVDKLDEFDPRLDNYAGTAVVSVHADSCDYINDLATGFKISGSGLTNSTPLSICIEDGYRNATQMNYHANTITPDMADYHAFRSFAPGTQAVIIEVGFMYLDREMITTNSDIPAQGLTDGILCFLDQHKQTKATN
jgi:N-acetylmuramoyl-L-alanine amidase